jgi:hypothetical protein
MKINDRISLQNPKSPILMASVPTVLLKHIILQMSIQELDKVKKHFDHLQKCP